MFDGLTAAYGFPCPARQARVRVRLSAFRALERLPGPAHPAVYRVRFACACGGEHEGLVSHDELDLAPVVGARDAPPFYNVLTGRLEPSEPELVEQAALKLRGGNWPWTLFCAAEEQPRPLSPSQLRLVAPEAGGLVIAARCPACATTSVNYCSHLHVDVPFFNDRRVGVLEHAFTDRELDDDALGAELADPHYPSVLRDLAA